MSRYIKYTPTQNDFATLRFVNTQAIEVKWFDTHVVAVPDNADFDALMSEQHPECAAMEIGFDEFFGLAMQSSQAKFSLEHIERDFRTAMTIANGGASTEEQLTFAKQEAEAKIVINGGESALLSALAEARGKGETVSELAGKIIAKANTNAAQIADALGSYQAKRKSVFM